MALAINPMGKYTPPVEETPRIYNEHYKHSIVDSSFEPSSHLLTQVDGTPRLFEAYIPSVAQHEEILSFGSLEAPTYQSYIRIKQLIIKQEGRGSYNFNPERAESTEIMNGWVFIDRPMPKGSVLIADIGGGKAGLFEVTEQPEIRATIGEKVYYITYQLRGVLTEQVFTELDSRVVSEFVFSKDSSLHGGVNVITKPEYDTMTRLMKWKVTIANYIMSNHYWNTERTIAFKDESGKVTYDPYLVNFIAAVLDQDLRGSYPPITQFSTQYGGRQYGLSGSVNVWTALLRGDYNSLKNCNNKGWLIDRQRTKSTRLYGNISNTAFDAFIVTDPEEYRVVRTYYSVDPIYKVTPSFSEEFTYMFSEGFYNGVPADDFELILTKALRDNIIDREAMLAYCEKFFTLTDHSKLYHGAILIMLINVSRKIGSNL